MFPWNKFSKTPVNSLGPSDAIWRQRSGSTLAQVIACCLTAPSNYLNQCWLIISEVQWHSYQDNFTTDASTINHKNPFENFISKFQSNFPGANELIGRYKKTSTPPATENAMGLVIKIPKQVTHINSVVEISGMSSGREVRVIVTSSDERDICSAATLWESCMEVRQTQLLYKKALNSFLLGAGW